MQGGQVLGEHKGRETRVIIAAFRRGKELGSAARPWPRRATPRSAANWAGDNDDAAPASVNISREMGLVKETAAGFCEKQVAGLTEVTPQDESVRVNAVETAAVRLRDLPNERVPDMLIVAAAAVRSRRDRQNRHNRTRRCARRE